MNLHKMPKIELHCHLDGSVRPSTLLELAAQSNLDFPVHDLQSFMTYVQVPPDCTSLIDYLGKFNIPLSVMQDANALERITYEVLADAAAENVKHMELRFAPSLHQNKGLSKSEVIQAVLKGQKAAMKEFQLSGGLILCAMRHESVETAFDTLHAGEPFLGDGVVAMDLAGNEHDFAPELFTTVFDRAKACGYRITIHAGETGIGANIEKSIRLLHAERIGHGTYAHNHLASRSLLKESNILLEVCPTSNLQTKAITTISSHPAKDYMSMGIPCNISTDNRTVSGVTLTHEYEAVQRAFPLDSNQLKKIYLDSVHASFADEKTKEHLRSFATSNFF